MPSLQYRIKHGVSKQKSSQGRKCHEFMNENIHTHTHSMSNTLHSTHPVTLCCITARVCMCECVRSEYNRRETCNVTLFWLLSPSHSPGGRLHFAQTHPSSCAHTHKRAHICVPGHTHIHTRSWDAGVLDMAQHFSRWPGCYAISHHSNMLSFSSFSLSFSPPL